MFGKYSRSDAYITYFLEELHERYKRSIEFHKHLIKPLALQQLNTLCIVLCQGLVFGRVLANSLNKV